LKPTLRYKENTTKRYGSGNNGRVGFSPPLQTASSHRPSRESGNPDHWAAEIFKSRLKVRDSRFPFSRE
ncbi:hypothetical protein, partial [Neisseria lactamica]|uniref:hypothetical protein n=1 Tax=Neisseria lactamica TaxID=486 RepID=UPI0027DF0D99